MGWETGVNKKFSEAPQFYGLYSLLIFLGAGIILLPGIPLFSVMYVSQVVNGIVLPVILVFMLLLINNKKLMGEYANKTGLQHHLLGHGRHPHRPDRRLSSSP